MRRTLLLDADVVAFKIAAVNETAIDWDGDGDVQVFANEADARKQMTKYVEELLDLSGSDEVVVCLSDKTGRYYRHDFFPEYKAHRSHGRRPELLTKMKDMLAEEWTSYRKSRLEADDVLGILQTKPGMFEGETVICTTDKDLRQIPGLHVNMKTWEIEEVSREEGEMFFYAQVLTGDTCDGFKGCPGIGLVRAFRIFEEWRCEEKHDTPWPYIVKAYEKKGLTEEDAIIQARVARILRHGEYDYKNKEPILWKP